MAKRRPKQRGGKREGAGRPQQFAKLVPLAVSVEPQQLDLLDHWRAAFGWSRSEAVRWMIPQVVERTTEVEK